VNLSAEASNVRIAHIIGNDQQDVGVFNILSMCASKGNRIQEHGGKESKGSGFHCFDVSW
jgi:hypothetical protein